MLSSLLNLQQGDVISLTGAGGKTSTLLRLAREMPQYKVLLTTTTKFGLHALEEFDRVSIAPQPRQGFLQSPDPGIYFAASALADNRKIIGFPPDILSSFLSYFDICVIEADGSRQKPLKGWKETEPVIIKETTRTIGILPLHALGRPISPELVHNMALYCAVTGASPGDPVDMRQMRSLICHPAGLFQFAKGERILLINQIDNPAQTYLVEHLLRELRPDERAGLAAIIAGSALNGEYWRFL